MSSTAGVSNHLLGLLVVQRLAKTSAVKLCQGYEGAPPQLRATLHNQWSKGKGREDWTADFRIPECPMFLDPLLMELLLFWKRGHFY